MPGPLPPRLSIAQCAAACLAAALCLAPGGAARAGPTSDCVTPENTPGIAIADMCILLDTTELDLRIDALTDLSPLAGLTALRRLGIFETQVTDLSPLAGLTNLWKLQVPDGTQYSTRAAIQDAIAAASP